MAHSGFNMDPLMLLQDNNPSVIGHETSGHVGKLGREKIMFGFGDAWQ
ncbi:MAG: hypothetical protein CM1200mP39_17500 [Dehalococcoidia bacterium]|nr:MAG: hypothetical protein CM1200mP39_17500 [Dehalococcoidia bacterium]